jgi:diguanylate cyclase (GGDEF)-like protein
LHPSLPASLPALLRQLLLVAGLCACFAAGAASDRSASWPERRAALRARIDTLQATAPQAQVLAAMAELRAQAQAAGDADTVNLMDIQRIYMTHEDAAIDASLDALHAVRARVTDHAPMEVREAMERAYGNMYFDAGNFDSALGHQLAALALVRALPDPASARLYRLGTIAELYNAMGLPEDALAYTARAESLGGPAMPDRNRLQLLANRAMALQQLGRMDEAAAALDAAQALARRAGSDFDRARMAAFQAVLLLARRQPAQALAELDEIAATQAGRSPYYRLRTQLLRGQALIDLGQPTQGLVQMRAATAGFEASGQMVDVLDGLARQADALERAGQPAQALAATRQLLALRQRLFRSEHARALAELDAARQASGLAQRAERLVARNRLQEAQLRGERLRAWLAVAVALLALAASLALFLMIRRTRGERDRLSRAIRLDPLTGAMSRYQFECDATVAAPPGDRVQAIALLDIDHFKAINDQYGHAAGDKVLRAVVAQLQQALGAHGRVYRWGGEEFLLVIDGPEPAAVEARLHAAVDAVQTHPVRWGDARLPVSVSGGAVFQPFAPGWKAPLADAVRWADAALYSAKQAGRRRITVVEPTATGANALRGSRPIDLAQLLDWAREALVTLRSL